jgi:hypothetical protein
VFRTRTRGEGDVSLTRVTTLSGAAWEVLGLDSATGLPDLGVPFFQLAESGFLQTQGYGSVTVPLFLLLISWAELRLVRVSPCSTSLVALESRLTQKLLLVRQCSS